MAGSWSDVSAGARSKPRKGAKTLAATGGRTLGLGAVALATLFLSQPLWAGRTASEDGEKNGQTPEFMQYIRRTDRPPPGPSSFPGTGTGLDEDLLSEPVQVVDMKLSLLEISPAGTKTRALSSERLPDGGGLAGEVAFRSGASGESVHLRYSFQIGVLAGGKTKLDLSIGAGAATGAPTQKSLVLGDGEAALVEFMEDPSRELRYAFKVVPRARTIAPSQVYPKLLTSLKLDAGAMFFDGRFLMEVGGLEGSGETVFLRVCVADVGTFVVSFKPFAGARACGTARGGVLRFKLGEHELKWISATPFLPEGKWRVFARFEPEAGPSGNGRKPCGESSVMVSAGE